MIKTKIDVPAGIRFIGEWQGFSLPTGAHILDKKIPGCGFTEWAIRCLLDVILCGPRKLLLGNKAEQHDGEVFYVINDFEEVLGIDKDLNRLSKRTIKDPLINEELRKEFFKKLTADIMKYVGERHSKGLPAKILVTYDSFNLVHSILNYNNLLQTFQVIVDEFQSIFTDSRFKSTTEMKFMNYLSRTSNVCFVSATPMMEEYLDQMPEFKDLPYYELDWNSLQPGRIIKPDLKVLKSKAVSTTAKEIIDKYKSGKFDYAVSPVTGQIVYSKEAVIYVNSVNNIINIIKKCSLVPDEVNILCAHTPDNAKRIRKTLGKKFTIGKVPLRGDIHKMFTLCTRTVYLGADFYSLCAKSFVISDANIDTLAVDISLDLPQILGRQRLEENPWRNKATFYYKPLANGKVLTKDDFDETINYKLKLTNDVLISFNSTPVGNREGLLGKCYRDARQNNYKGDYVAVDNTYDSSGKVITKIPTQNKLVILAEQRAYDIQQIDYKDRFSVFNSIRNIAGNQELEGVRDFFSAYEQIEGFTEKLKFLCEYEFDDEVTKNAVLDSISEKHFKEYYLVLGPTRCRSLGYDITKLNKEISIISFDKDIVAEQVKNTFVDDFYTAADAKVMLSNIYSSLGYQETPKATDLAKYLSVTVTSKRVVLPDGTKKLMRGFKINREDQ